jgi:membrane associated rhomboid family serine protease/Zn-finger nucleic acid-binding protein
MRCPRCTFTLVPRFIDDAELDVCPRCHGLFIDHGESLLGALGDTRTWGTRGVAQLVGKSALHCPKDDALLVAWRVRGLANDDGTASADVEVDTCRTCGGLWLDNTEVEALTRAAARLHSPPPPPRHDHGHLTLNEPPPGQERSGVAWYLLQLVTSMPVEVYNPKRRVAVVCLALIVANCVAFVVELAAIGGGDEDFIRRYGAVTNNLLNGYMLSSSVTHMFLHGGFAHLLGNMWFLWTFGDNVEDRVGRVRFVFLYLGCGLAALVFQMVLGGAPDVPLVGASGAISGLLGAYLGLFPRARIYQVILFIRWKIPATLYLGVWAAINLLLGLANKAGESGVAWWAHVGGFVAGLCWMMLMGRRFRDGAELTETSAPKPA